MIFDSESVNSIDEMKAAISVFCTEGIDGVDALINDFSLYFRDVHFNDMKHDAVNDLVGNILISDMDNVEFSIFHRGRYFSREDYIKNGVLSSHEGWAEFHSNLVERLFLRKRHDLVEVVKRLGAVTNFESGSNKARKGKNNTSNDGPCGFLFKEMAIDADGFNFSEVYRDFIFALGDYAEEVDRFVLENTTPCIVKFTAKSKDPTSILTGILEFYINKFYLKNDSLDCFGLTFNGCGSNVEPDNVIYVDDVRNFNGRDVVY